MAGTSLLALIDDIASLLDDVGALTKTAAHKTAGVLGDDLALNAEQVAGVKADRELPVIWAVAKGSALNKLILVPTALALSYLLPWMISPLLMLGGAYLCYEGFEKVLHSLPGRDKTSKLHAAGPGKPNALGVTERHEDLAAFEKQKIKGAIRTDFILSAEIVVITLGTVQNEAFLTRALVVASIAAVLTIGVYVLVAGIVKLDDLGLSLVRGSTPNGAGITRRLGQVILWVAPRLLKTLSVLGTIAMFLVGGGILVHGIPPVSGWVHGVEHAAEHLPSLGTIIATLVPTLLNGLVGIVAGGLAVGGHHLFAQLRGSSAVSHEQ